MSDLISRQAVRLVEMDGKKEHPTFNLDDAYEQGFEDCLEKVLALPSAQPEQHLCRDCKWVKYYGNVDKNGNVESYWHCMNWDGGTDEEGYCHEWESR